MHQRMTTEGKAMNIYRLERAKCGYDEVSGFIVVARSEVDARRFAADEAGDEGCDVWQTVPCVCLGTAKEGVPGGVHLRDFCAG